MWACSSKKNIQLKQRKQNKAARIILGIRNDDRIARSAVLIKQLGLMNIRQRRNYFLTKITFESMLGVTPDYLSSKIIRIRVLSKTLEECSRLEIRANHTLWYFSDTLSRRRVSRNHEGSRSSGEVSSRCHGQSQRSKRVVHVEKPVHSPVNPKQVCYTNLGYCLQLEFAPMPALRD